MRFGFSLLNRKKPPTFMSPNAGGKNYEENDRKDQFLFESNNRYNI